MIVYFLHISLLYVSFLVYFLHRSLLHVSFFRINFPFQNYKNFSATNLTIRRIIAADFFIYVQLKQRVQGVNSLKRIRLITKGELILDKTFLMLKLEALAMDFNKIPDEVIGEGI